MRFNAMRKIVLALLVCLVCGGCTDEIAGSNGKYRDGDYVINKGRAESPKYIVAHHRRDAGISVDTVTTVRWQGDQRLIEVWAASELIKEK